MIYFVSLLTFLETFNKLNKSRSPCSVVDGDNLIASSSIQIPSECSQHLSTWAYTKSTEHTRLLYPPMTKMPRGRRWPVERAQQSSTAYLNLTTRSSGSEACICCSASPAIGQFPAAGTSNVLSNLQRRARDWVARHRADIRPANRCRTVLPLTARVEIPLRPPASKRCMMSTGQVDRRLSWQSLTLLTLLLRGLARVIRHREPVSILH